MDRSRKERVFRTRPDQPLLVVSEVPATASVDDASGDAAEAASDDDVNDDVNVDVDDLSEPGDHGDTDPTPHE